MTRYHFGLFAIIALGYVLFVLVPLAARSSSTTIDCGPEGKPALNGTACIDREPAYTTYP